MNTQVELKWQASWLLGEDALDTIHHGMVDLINDLDNMPTEQQLTMQAADNNVSSKQGYTLINEKIECSFLPLLNDLNSMLMQFVYALDKKDTRTRGRHYKMYKQGILTVLDELIYYVKNLANTQRVDENCMSEIKQRFGLHMRSIVIFMRIYNAADPREITYLCGRQQYSA